MYSAQPLLVQTTRQIGPTPQNSQRTPREQLFGTTKGENLTSKSGFRLKTRILHPATRLEVSLFHVGLRLLRQTPVDDGFYWHLPRWLLARYSTIESMSQARSNGAAALKTLTSAAWVRFLPDWTLGFHLVWFPNLVFGMAYKLTSKL